MVELVEFKTKVLNSTISRLPSCLEMHQFLQIPQVKIGKLDFFPMNQKIESVSIFFPMAVVLVTPPTLYKPSATVLFHFVSKLIFS